MPAFSSDPSPFTVRARGRVVEYVSEICVLFLSYSMAEYFFLLHDIY